MAKKLIGTNSYLRLQQQYPVGSNLMPAYLLDVRPHLEYTSDTDVVNTKAARCGREVGVAWEAADHVCGKRLKPFLPGLTAVLKRHTELFAKCARQN